MFEIWGQLELSRPYRDTYLFLLQMREPQVGKSSVDQIMGRLVVKSEKLTGVR